MRQEESLGQVHLDERHLDYTFFFLFLTKSDSFNVIPPLPVSFATVF